MAWVRRKRCLEYVFNDAIEDIGIRPAELGPRVVPHSFDYHALFDQTVLIGIGSLPIRVKPELGHEQLHADLHQVFASSHDIFEDLASSACKAATALQLVQ